MRRFFERGGQGNLAGGDPWARSLDRSHNGTHLWDEERRFRCQKCTAARRGARAICRLCIVKHTCRLRTCTVTTGFQSCSPSRARASDSRDAASQRHGLRCDHRCYNEGTTTSERMAREGGVGAASFPTYAENLWLQSLSDGHILRHHYHLCYKHSSSGVTDSSVLKKGVSTANHPGAGRATAELRLFLLMSRPACTLGVSHDVTRCILTQKQS